MSKCIVANCASEADATIDAIVNSRSASQYQFCSTHADDFLNHHLSQTRRGTGTDGQLFGAVPFGIELIVMRAPWEHVDLYMSEVSGNRQFFWRFGIFEGTAIQRITQGKTPSRPLTHKTMATVICTLGGLVTEVFINAYQEESDAFLAILRIQQGSHQHEVDCRASDALALSLICDVPFFISEVLVRKKGFWPSARIG